MKRYFLILSIISLAIANHFNVEIEETGESTLFIFQNSITTLDVGDELGVFDATGIDNNGEINEVLVGAGVWEGEQIAITAISAVDLSAFGGPILPGAVSGHPMILKVWDFSSESELNVTYDILSGTGTFNGLFTAISEINTCDLSDGFCDCLGNILDECGVCGGPGAIYECGCSDIPDGACDCNNNFLDCLGICNGDAIFDDCGICNGPGEIYECGCSGIPENYCDCQGNIDLGCGCGEPGPSGCDNQCGSNAIIDECGICDGPGILEGECDCEGNILDECEVCGGPGTIYECGCYGVQLGTCDCDGNILDECGICGGDGPQIWCGFPDFIYVCTEEECSEDGIGGDDGGTSTGGATGGTTGGFESIDYESEIEPIFANHCNECHSYGGGYFGGLDLTSYDNLMNGGVSGDAVYPYYSSGSLLIQKLYGTASGEQMPLNASPLDDSTINLIASWIDQGAIGPDPGGDTDGCDNGEIYDCDGSCVNQSFLENEICNEGLDGEPNFNCSALFFDGDCLDNFENCTPDCPVGILDFGNISVDLEDNVIVGQLEIIMDCEFDVTDFSINLSDELIITEVIGGTAIDNNFNVTYSNSLIEVLGSPNVLAAGEQTILVLNFETTNNNLCFNSSNITTSLGISYNAVLSDCISLGTYYSGWNWISINQSFDDMSLNSILGNLDGNAEFIKNQSGYADFYPEFGWFGTLDTIDNISMYKLKMLNSDALAYRGNNVNPDEVILSLLSGWNWIGYTPNINLDVNVALSNIPIGNAEFLKSQSGYTDFYPEFGWFGTLDTMSPLQGYLLRLAEDTEFTYNDNSLSNISSNYSFSQLSDNSYGLNINKYEYNGTMTSVLSIKGNIVDTYDFTLVAYDGSECVGFAEPLYFPLNSKIIFPLMVYGNNDGNMITFKIFDKKTNKYLPVDNKIEFKKDMILGDGYNPIILNASLEVPTHVAIRSIYPNPFNPSTEIHYSIEKPSNVVISIYDINGRFIVNLVNQMQLEGNHLIKWTPENLSSGIYLVKLIADNYITTKKIVLLK